MARTRRTVETETTESEVAPVIGETEFSDTDFAEISENGTFDFESETAMTDVVETETVETDNTETEVVESVEKSAEEIEAAKQAEIAEMYEQLNANPILIDFCNKYTATYNEIKEYNDSVLAAKNAEWTPAKVLAKAKEYGKPEEGVKGIEEITDLYDLYLGALEDFNDARKKLLDRTAQELGISLTATSEKDPVKEEKLKEDRKIAVVLGEQLSTIAKMISDENISAAVTKFLLTYPLPSVGREQAHSFGVSADGEKRATPKYRLNIKVYKDGTEILNADGITNAKLKLTQPVFGYDRGKAPSADKLRDMWESTGNSPDKTVHNSVEVEDNGLKYVLTKR